MSSFMCPFLKSFVGRAKKIVLREKGLFDEKNEQFSSLFLTALQTMQIGVVIRDALKKNKPIIFVNQAFMDLTGYSLDDLGSTPHGFLAGWLTDPTVLKAFYDSVEQQKSGTFEILSYRRDKTPFWGKWQLSPILNEKKVMTHYVGLLTDITNWHQTEESLRIAKEQAEHASSVKTNFLAVMSHEIRTPINGLLGILDLLKDSLTDGEQKRLLDVALASGQSLSAIINDILDYAKMEAGKATLTEAPFSLQKMLENTINLTQNVASKKALNLHFSVQKDVPDKLIGDEGRIRQILLNLITNAIKFTDKGSVELRVRHLVDQESENKTKTLLHFEVVDTGVGISAADQEKLFKEFSQIEHAHVRKFGGTGLGLAITRRLVTMLDGEIGVESKTGKGSKFWFVLPLIVASDEIWSLKCQDINEPEEISPEAKAKTRILYVEDNNTNQLITSRFLRKAGYDPDIASDGAEAVTMTYAKDYDLILMDISMPKMDGLEATRQIRAKGGVYEKIPIIALTAHVMSEDREACLAAGMNDHINKPLKYDTLVRKLNRWLFGKWEPLVTEQETKILVPEPTEVDTAILQQLSDELGQQALLHITQVFLEDSNRRIEELKIHGKMLEMNKIKHEAHTLKSSSANCGLMRFAALMSEIEMKAEEGNKNLVESLLKRIDSAYLSARKGLEVECDRYRY